MKLEFLPDGPNDMGLIRLYEYGPEDVRALKSIAFKLATGAAERVWLQTENWIVPLDGCRLSLQRGTSDCGMRRVGPLSFECELTAKGWQGVEGLLAPFCGEKMNIFQWLTQKGSVSFLISPNGRW
jgi:hypothetical protein